MAPSSTAVFLGEQAGTTAKQQMHSRSPSAVNACWYSTGLMNLGYLHKEKYKPDKLQPGNVSDACVHGEEVGGFSHQHRNQRRMHNVTVP